MLPPRLNPPLINKKTSKSIRKSVIASYVVLGQERHDVPHHVAFCLMIYNVKSKQTGKYYDNLAVTKSYMCFNTRNLGHNCMLDVRHRYKECYRWCHSCTFKGSVTVYVQLVPSDWARGTWSIGCLVLNINKIYTIINGILCLCI